MLVDFKSRRWAVRFTPDEGEPEVKTFDRKPSIYEGLNALRGLPHRPKREPASRS